MEEIKIALDLKKTLDELRPIDSEQENRIMQKFRLDWNYHSNHLEGNSLNYGETKALLLFGITAQGKPLKDHFEITGHNEAINWVTDMVKGQRSLTENFIRELHRLLLKESYEVDAITPDGKPTKRKIAVGQYKTMPNHVKTITGEMFYFATPEETPSKMFDLLEWYRDKISGNEEVNPMFLAAEFHYKFIRIHPFDDGNGRTARILMNFILMQFGFPPVIIKTEDKANYFAALQLADAGNIEAFVIYIAQNLVYSLEMMIAGAKGEDIEEDDDLDKEIALLEQKLSGFGDEIKEHKSKENIIKVFEELIIPTAKKIENKLSKFDDYYLFKNILINIDGKSYHLSDLLFPDESFGKIKIIINYYKLKIKGIEDFDFHSEIEVIFGDLYYNLSIRNNKKKEYIKLYDEKIFEKEINEIANIVVKTHNMLLDQKIAEKEGEL